MKWINYKVNRPVNVGSDDNPVWEDNIVDKKMRYSEKNLSVVLKEAYNGEYTIDDDGQPEIVTDAQRIAELEEALEMLLSGVTE